MPPASTAGQTGPAQPVGGPQFPPSAPGPIDLGSPSSVPGAQPAMHYWMKTTNGHEYGPVDRVTLTRWFSEGRVGPGYEIRAGEFGAWQPAHTFQPQALSGSTNPFASYPSAPGTMPLGRQYPKPDQSGMILAMGILSWIVCPICGIIAWVMGSQALKDIQQGQADPTNRGLIQVGYYLGMVNVILAICCFGFYVLIIALVAITGNF